MKYAANATPQHRFTRRTFLKALLAAGATAALSADYVLDIEPAWVQIDRVKLTLPRLPAAFQGYRIAQISDLHMGDWLDRAHFQQVVDYINGVRPDLIAITGDFVTRRPELVAADLAATLGQLRARDGTVAVLGNHDYHGPELIREVLRESGITDLSNRVHTLQRGGDLFHIAGVDDVWQQRAQLDEVLAKLPGEGAAMLLAHEPDFADTTAPTGRFDLQISGHSHGGQVVFPFSKPSHLPYLGKKYPSGLYQVGDMLQYTNRGIGMVRPHVRLNCRPEVTLFTLA